MNKRVKGGFLVARIHQLGDRIFNRKLKEYNIDINSHQGRIMFVLWKDDEISISKLAKKTSLSKSTLTSMLDRLEKSGYIKRISASEDRRKILIKRTEKDKSMQDIYTQVSKDMTELFYEGFSDNEIDKFEEFLARILCNLMECKEN